MTDPTETLKEKAQECNHEWETSYGWGVIIGVSKCLRCGKVSSSKDFAVRETERK